MSTSIVEIIRQLHQDVEGQLNKSIDELSKELKRHRENIHRNHTVAQRVKMVAENIQRLKDMYTDETGALQREIRSISGNNEYSYHNFMRQYDEIVKRYANRPELNTIVEDIDETLVMVPSLDDIFTPGELYGRSIDIQYYHQGYISLSIVKSKVRSMSGSGEGLYLPHTINPRYTRLYTQITYTTFLQHFDDLSLLIEYQCKLTSPLSELEEYNTWLAGLCNYMQLFYFKVYPLIQFDDIVSEMVDEFNTLYDGKQLLGYFPYPSVLNHRQPKEYGIPVDQYYTYDKYIDPSLSPSSSTTTPSPSSTTTTTTSLPGVDTYMGKSEDVAVKDEQNPTKTEEVTNNPLYCKPCAKLFAKDTVYNAHLNGKNHKRMLAKYTSSQQSQQQDESPLQPSSSPSSTNHSNMPIDDSKKDIISSHSGIPSQKAEVIRSIAKYEFLLSIFADLLRQVITFTVEIAERKSSTTLSELYVDLNISDDEGDDDQTPTGNQVVGANNTFTTVGGQRQFIVDGRPIPIWLYKLHGLNIKYSCEVCGGDTFLGERNYKIHFNNWKHTYMLKCLNITNSKEYVDVSRIQDVLDLQAKLAAQNETTVTQMIETEDILGNIYQQPAKP